MQQIEPSAPPAPSSSGPGLTIERKDSGKMPPSAPFEIKVIQISGSTLFETQVLHALVADIEGKMLTLAQLDEAAARITDHYSRHGYLLSRAFIPAQTIQNGNVRIEIIEARYGKINLDNSSQVSEPLLQETLLALQGGHVIGQAELDRSLLLLSDIPGIAINATLKPGETAGTSDLTVETMPGQAISGNAVLDNYGSRYTGKARAGLTANFNNPLRHGDYFSFSGITSGLGFKYGRGIYEYLLNGEGTRLGFSYSDLQYALGDELASLKGKGSARVVSYWVKYPFMRSQNASFFGRVQYDQKKIRDHIDTASVRRDRHLGNWTLSLSGDVRDALAAGSVDTWSVGWEAGRIGFDDMPTQLSDASAAKTRGSFGKWSVNLGHTQGLSTRSNFYLGFSSQWASKNLDSSEKMLAGGPYTVRAYDMGAISGDTGYLGVAEYRYDLGYAPGKWQAVVFVDSAHVTVNRNAWTPETNSATLTGAGVGLNWVGTDMWSVKACVAKRLGSSPEPVGSSSSTRAWAEVGKGF